MCLIVDTNAAADFLAQPSGVRDWLLGDRGNPRLVAAGRLLEELVRNNAVRRLLRVLEQAGRLRSVFSDVLPREETQLRTRALCRPNDLHVLALAIASGARTLATLDDNLTTDFRNPRIINRPRGSIYRNPKVHAHLLRHTPSSCSVKAGDGAGKRRRS